MPRTYTFITRKPRAEAKVAQAQAAGQATYRGRPCKHGHSGLRYVSNWKCVGCVLAEDHIYKENHKITISNALLALYYPEEFEIKGWRRKLPPNANWLA